MGRLINILSNIISESKRIKLDLETISQIEFFTNKIYKKKFSRFRNNEIVGSLSFKTSDGVPGQTEIVLTDEIPDLGSLEQKVEDSRDPNDFILFINPKKITSKKFLYQTLFHEIMHATDPVFTTKHSEKVWSTYDPEIDEKYWAHPIEFRALTNEFLEGLVREFSIRKSRLKNIENIIYLNKAVDSILNYFAKGTRINRLAYSIIEEISDDIYFNNILNKLLKKITVDFPDVSEIMPERKKPLQYIEVLEYIKEYDPEIWKRFLSMVYSTVDEIKSFLRK